MDWIADTLGESGLVGSGIMKEPEGSQIVWLGVQPGSGTQPQFEVPGDLVKSWHKHKLLTLTQISMGVYSKHYKGNCYNNDNLI